MSRKLLTILMSILSVMFIFRWSTPYAGETEKGPIIHIETRHHVFPPVFEGEELSHTFTVHNQGTVDLEIRKVTHS